MTTTLEIKPGFLLASNNHAMGGIRSVRSVENEQSINNGEGTETDVKITHIVDHVALCTEGRQIVAAARYSLRVHALKTGMGYVCTPEKYPEIQTIFQGFKTQAADFNTRARMAGCGHRIKVGFAAFKIEVSNTEAAQSIFDTVRETLIELSTKLKEGLTAKPEQVLYVKCKTLDTLAAGVLKFSVQDAVACGQESLTELRLAKKEGRDPVLDLDRIESAVGMFTNVDYDSVAETF